MQRLILLALLVPLGARAGELRLGADVGVWALTKAASQAPAFSPSLTVDWAASDVFSLGAEAGFGGFAEDNDTVRQRTSAQRLALRVDARIERNGLSARLGLGPGLALVHTRVQPVDGGDYRGTVLRPGLRLRSEVGGRFSDALGWRLTGGALGHGAGVDWDAGVGLVWTLGGAS